MKMSETHENDFIVNERDLDGEWLRQSVLYNKWAGLAATALKKQAQLHLKRKILKAELYKSAKIKLSNMPGSKEGKEPTGAAIEAEIRTNPEYKNVSEQLIDAEEQTALMEAGKWSMVEKSKALDRLCVDRDKGFFMATGSKPVQGNYEERIQKAKEEADKGLRDQINKKKISRG